MYLKLLNHTVSAFVGLVERVCNFILKNLNTLRTSTLMIFITTKNCNRWVELAHFDDNWDESSKSR